MKTYIGITTNPEKRLNSHNSGFGKYTKRYRPCVLIYLESHSNRKLARRREIHFMTAASRRWIKKNIFKE